MSLLLLLLPILFFIPGLSIWKFDYHYIHEKVLRKDLHIGFVSGKDNLANIFTKPLSAPPFLFFHSKLLVDSSSCCLRGDVEEPGAQATKKLKLSLVQQ